MLIELDRILLNSDLWGFDVNDQLKFFFPDNDNIHFISTNLDDLEGHLSTGMFHKPINDPAEQFAKFEGGGAEDKWIGGSEYHGRTARSVESQREDGDDDVKEGEPRRTPGAASSSSRPADEETMMDTGEEEGPGEQEIKRRLILIVSIGGVALNRSSRSFS